MCARATLKIWLILKKERILDDSCQEPVVMAPVPDLIGLLGNSSGSLFILPQGVQLYKEGKEKQEIGTHALQPQQAVAAFLASQYL